MKPVPTMTLICNLLIATLPQPCVKQLSWLYPHIAPSPSARPFTGMSKSASIIFGNLTYKFLTRLLFLPFTSFFCFPEAILPVITLNFNTFKCS